MRFSLFFALGLLNCTPSSLPLSSDEAAATLCTDLGGYISASVKARGNSCNNPLSRDMWITNGSYYKAAVEYCWDGPFQNCGTKIMAPGEKDWGWDCSHSGLLYVRAVPETQNAYSCRELVHTYKFSTY